MKGVRQFFAGRRAEAMQIIPLCILVICGLFAGIFADAIQAALTLPAERNMPQHAAAVAPIQTPVAATFVPAATSITGSVLAQDTFRRTGQALWGIASDGRTWQSDANNRRLSGVFSIATNTGVITRGQGTLNALLGPTTANAEVLVSGSMSRFGANVNFGVVLRWADTNNWYKALIDGANLMLLKRVNGVTTRLGVVPFKAQGNRLYTFRFRALGPMLFAKVWPSAAPEPATWMVSATDMSLTAGQGGVRVLVQNDVVVKVASFLETTGSGGL